MGGNAEMLKVSSAGLDVVIMTNRHDKFAILLAEKILDACLLDLDPVKESVSSLLASGIFRSPTSGRVVQLFNKQGHRFASIDGIDMPVEPNESGELWPTGIWRYVKQGVTLEGNSPNPPSIRLSDFGNIDELAAVKPVDEPNVGAIAGHYRADAIAIEATISDTPEGPRLRTVGQLGSTAFPLECLADGIWRARSKDPMSWGGILAFDNVGARFRFSTFRTWSVIFRRVS